MIFASTNHVVGLYEREFAPDIYDSDFELTVDHNPNCAWKDGAPPDGETSAVPEIDLLRRAIVDGMGGEATYLVDCHSHADWYDRFMWYADGDDSDAVALVEAIHEADADGSDEAVVGSTVRGDAPDPIGEPRNDERTKR